MNIEVGKYYKFVHPYNENSGKIYKIVEKSYIHDCWIVEGWSIPINVCWLKNVSKLEKVLK